MCRVLPIDPSEIKLPDYGARARIEEAGRRYTFKLVEAAQLEKQKREKAETAKIAVEQKAAFALALVVAKYRMVEILGESPKAVIREVAHRHGLTPEHLTGQQRTAPVARARQEAMYEIRRRHPALSLPQIGVLFGKRDHTTCLHGIRMHATRFGLPLPESNYPNRRPKWGRGGAIERVVRL